ncbi:unnamed protein product [Camellia sinensis]
MATRYWVVSLPVQNCASSLWTRLQQSISKRAFDTPTYLQYSQSSFGTLNSLLALSDDLLKSNSFIEGVSHKIRRQIEELERVSGVVSSSLTVDGVPVDSYLTRNNVFDGSYILNGLDYRHECGLWPTKAELSSPLERSQVHLILCIVQNNEEAYIGKFVWDEAKYPTVSPLKEIVDGIHVQVAKIEDELKVCGRMLGKMWNLVLAMIIVVWFVPRSVREDELMEKESVVCSTTATCLMWYL